MISIKYPAAKLHKFLHAAPQFRPIRRGTRRKYIERTYKKRDGSCSLTMMLFYELDIADQDLLLCIVAMAMITDKSTVITSKPNQELNMILREDLKLNGDAVTKMDAISIRSTGYELLTELGKTTGKSNYQWLESSLKRLSGVRFIYKSAPEIVQFNLMSFSVRHNETGRLDGIFVCINPYSALAIMGGGDGYVLLHRRERAQLNSDESKALHSVLCGLVDMGRERVLSRYAVQKDLLHI